jgi:hypothetical protein
MSAGVVVLLVAVVVLPSAIMGTAIYVAPRAIPWARARARRKRERRSRRRGPGAPA